MTPPTIDEAIATLDRFAAMKEQLGNAPRHGQASRDVGEKHLYLAASIRVLIADVRLRLDDGK